MVAQTLAVPVQPYSFEGFCMKVLHGDINVLGFVMKNLNVWDCCVPQEQLSPPQV